jgi:DNA-binding transcriptional LysR family regulator
MPEAPILTRARLTGKRTSASHGTAGPSIKGAGAGGSGMNWGSVDLNLLIVFDVLMQERTITRAGKRLGLSQPAASHALARLRHMLHDDLFIRTPEGMQPTPRAAQMAEPVRDALRALSMTLEPESFDPATAEHDFTIAVNNYAARAVVPALVREAGNAAPRVSLEIQPIGMREVLDQLDAGGMDVALTTLADGGERFRCVRVMDDDYVVLLGKHHATAAEAELSAELVAEIPHIGITSSGEDTGFIDAALDALGLTRRIATRVPFLSIELMLVKSDLLAVVPRRVAVDLASICPLVVKELPFPSPRLALSMIWHRRVDNDASHRWLREIIKTSARA